MKPTKAQLFVPRLLPGIERDNPPTSLALTDAESAILAHVDGTNSLAEIQEETNLDLKDLLLCAKSLAKKKVIQLIKRSEQEFAAAEARKAQAAQAPKPALGAVEVKQKQMQVEDLAIFEKRQSERRKAQIQRGSSRLPNKTLDALEARRRPRETKAPAPRGLMRSMHTSALSAEIDKLLQDEPAATPAAPETAAPSIALGPPPTTPTPSKTPEPASFLPGEAPNEWQDASATNEDLLAHSEAPIHVPQEQEFSFDFGDEPEEKLNSFESLEADLPMGNADSLEADLPFELEQLEVPPAQYSQPIAQPPRPPRHTPTSLLSMPVQEEPDGLELLDFDVDVDITSEVRQVSHHKTSEVKQVSHHKTNEMPHLTAAQAAPQESIFDLQDLEQRASELPDNAAPQFVLAHDILTGFARVIATFRLYDARNSAVKDALAQLHRHIGQYLSAHEDLNLELTPWSFVLEGQKVYTNSDRESSLAFKLYRDGIRHLRFTKGFDGRQLALLLQLLASAQNTINRSEDDLVTLFWQANFANAHIVAIEGFQLKGGDEEASSVEMLFARLSEEDAADIAYDKDDTTHNAIVQQRFLNHERMADLLAQLSVSPALSSPLSSAAIEAIEREETTPRWQHRLPHLLALIEHKLPGEAEINPKAARQIHTWLQSATAEMLRDAHTDGLSLLLQRGSEWREQSERPALHDAAAAIQSVFSDEGLLKQLINGLELEDGETLPQHWVQLFRSSPTDSTPTLFNLLEQGIREQSKPALRQLLIALLNGESQPFSDRLSSASAELCVELLECLQMLGTNEAFELIGAQIHHSSQLVQDTVLRMAETLSQQAQRSGHIRQVITKLLNSDDPLQRGRAYKVMEQSNDGRWAMTLHKLLQESHHLDRDELEAIARLAAKLNPESTLRLIVQLAAPPKRLGIERQWRKNQRYASIHALASIGNLGAEEHLRKLLKSNHADSKQLAIDAMRELRRSQHAPTSATPANATIEEVPSITKNKANTKSKQDKVSQAEFDALHEDMIAVLDKLDLGANDDAQSHLRDDGATFVTLLHVLFKTAVLYDPNNKIFERPIRELLDVQQRLFDALPEITIVGIEEQFYIDDLRVRMQSANVKQSCRELCEEFAGISLGGMSFLAPMTADQWRLFTQVYAGREGNKAEDWKALQEQLKRAGLHQHVQLLSEVTYHVGQEKQQNDPLHIYAQALDGMGELWKSVAAGRAPHVLPLRRAFQRIADRLLREPDERWGMLAFIDHATPLKTHLLNVAILAMRIGHHIGLKRTQLVDLGMCASCHDIGYISPFELSDDHGAEATWFMLQQSFQSAQARRALVALHHHHNYMPPEDEDAHPEPDLFSRITRLADTYDTLTTEPLCQKHAVSPAQLLQRMASDPGQLFDPTLTQALINTMGCYPVGTMLELNDGAIGISLGTRPHPEAFERPLCLIVKRGRDNTHFGQELDLEDPSHQHREVVRYHTPSPEQSPRRTVTDYYQRNS